MASWRVMFHELEQAYIINITHSLPEGEDEKAWVESRARAEASAEAAKKKLKPKELKLKDITRLTGPVSSGGNQSPSTNTPEPESENTEEPSGGGMPKYGVPSEDRITKEG